MNTHPQDDPDLPKAADTQAADSASAPPAPPKRRARAPKPAPVAESVVAASPADNTHHDAADHAPDNVPDTVLDSAPVAVREAPVPASPAPPRPRKRAAPRAAAEAVDLAPTASVESAAAEISISRDETPQHGVSDSAATPSTAAREVAGHGVAAPAADGNSPTTAGPHVAAASPDGIGTDPSGPGESGGAEPADGTPRRSERSRNRRRGKRSGSATTTGQPSQAAGEGVADASAPFAPPGLPLVPAMPFVDVGEIFASVMSGDFDVEPAEAIAEPVEALPKRVLAAEPEAPKLHKVLAQSGIGSRRDMEQLILDGHVTVNGEPAHTGQRISFGDQIRVSGKLVKVRIAPPPARVIAYHKPAGEVVTYDDPQQRPTVFRRLPRLPHGKWQSVGRLDINTEGLLLFTTSGDLANKLMHPRFGVEREYAVRVLGQLETAARDQLLAGVNVEGQTASFKSVEDGGGEGANHWYRVVITEGRNREVRKLFDAVGLVVSRLIRIRYGCVVLPRGLKRGVCVDLSDSDVRALRQLSGADQGVRDSGPRGSRPQDRQTERNDRRHDRAPERDNARPSERSARPPDRGSAKRQGGRPERPERGDPNTIPNPLQTSFDPARRQRPRQGGEAGDPGTIPNPLQQTYDKRALQQQQRQVPINDLDEDGPIPNPLQQTYDRRFVQKPRGQGGRDAAGGGKKSNAPRQPDPMQTSVGYIGADAFQRKTQGRGGRRGR